MIRRLKNIWRPQNFHLQHMIGRGKSCFEGWYFKLVDAAGGQPYAIIPGVFLGADSHAFIQVLDGLAGNSTYHRFELSEFRASRDSFDVEIGRSHFNRSGISLDIRPEDTDSRQRIQGNIQFTDWKGWPVTTTSPGVMGPYSFVPFMECNHGILSMNHSLSGEITVAGKRVSFDGGRGYTEKDWGRSFPSAYLWAQSNHFDEGEISISASVARIPWLTGSFRGHLIGFLLHDQLYRFTTYTGAEIEHISLDDESCSLSVRDQEHRLEIKATRTEGALLHAPYDKAMMERVAESMTSKIHVRLQGVRGNNILFEGSGEHGCLELQGDLNTILRS